MLGQHKENLKELEAEEAVLILAKDFSTSPETSLSINDTILSSGLDSVAIMSMALAFEHETDLTISSKEIANWKTLKDMADVLTDLRSGSEVAEEDINLEEHYSIKD
jgi:acyl carrier protein